MYDEAMKDLNRVLRLEPNNKQSKIDLEVLNNKIKQVYNKSHKFVIIIINNKLCIGCYKKNI